MKEYEKAMSYYTKAIAIKETLNSKKELSSLYYNIGLNAYQTGEYDKALINTEIALDYSEEVNDIRLMQDIYELLYTINKKTNNNTDALNAHEKYMSIKDSIFNTNKYEIINDLEKKYQTAEKEKENQKLQFENKLTKRENAKIKSRNLYIMSISGLTILLFVIALFAYNYIQKNKFNKLMLSEIDEQNDIISKNLHDGMSGYSHAIKNSLVFRNEKTKDLNKEISIIDRSQKELRFLMKQLSSHTIKTEISIYRKS